MQVLVVGAGVVGLAVARTVALRGHDVIVAEATGGIGNGVYGRELAEKGIRLAGPAAQGARPFCSIITHSNRVSSNRSLRCRETEFLGQRQSGRNGKSPLERECVVGLRGLELRAKHAVAIEPVSRE